MEGDSLKLNFEIALEKINTLTKHNQALMDKIQTLEYKLSQSNVVIEDTPQRRFDNVSKEADDAMNRYKQFLRKEFKNAKSKQSEGQPV
jgi:benzoyl-CoA reductase/2-hydroxyglutaryl-CoA dehydratase subunit BcrC/BadD/HgdB